LCIYGTCIRELKYAVYDRWGEKVFETEFAVNLDTKNYHEVCWDGTYKGKPLNSGVYAYKIYAALDNGEIIEESGNITLVK
jgi:gliding motility-associated-like protein